MLLFVVTALFIVFIANNIYINNEYQKIFDGPKRDFRDFKTYKKRFEILRPLFYLLSQANLVPKSFYLKYCFPLNIKR